LGLGLRMNANQQFQTTWKLSAAIVCVIGVAVAKIVSLQNEVARLSANVSDSDVQGQEMSHVWTANLVLLTLGLVVIRVGVILAKEMKHLKQKCSSTGASMSEVMSYRLDIIFSKSSTSKPIALLFATVVCILVGGSLFFLTGNKGISGSVFFAWMTIVDTSAHAGAGNPVEMLVGLAMTITGMVIFGFMIGIVTDMISEKMDSLKKGKSRVLENGHHVLCGWSDKTLPVIAELANANESEGGGMIVLLAHQDKEELEHLILSSHIDMRGSSVVVRSGAPTLPANLSKMSVQTAKSVIIFADPSLPPDESDSMVLRVVLALMGLDLAGHVVAELCDIDNRELITLVGKSKVETLVAHDMIGRVMLQCARAPGLAAVLDQVLGFDGSEFYMEEWGAAVGKRWGEVVFMFPDAVVVGVKQGSSGSITISPPDDYVVQAGDQVLVFAEDNDTYCAVQLDSRVLHALQEQTKKFVPPAAPACEAENLLLVGWRRDLDDMIMELDQLIAPGSNLTLFSAYPVHKRLRAMEDGGLNVDNLRNISLTHVVGNQVSRRHLERLKIESFDSVLILAEQDAEQDILQSDSRSLASLLLLRDIHTQRCIGHHYMAPASSTGNTPSASPAPAAAAAAAAAAAPAAAAAAAAPPTATREVGGRAAPTLSYASSSSSSTSSSPSPSPSLSPAVAAHSSALAQPAPHRGKGVGSSSSSSRHGVLGPASPPPPPQLVHSSAHAQSLLSSSSSSSSSSSRNRKLSDQNFLLELKQATTAVNSRRTTITSEILDVQTKNLLQTTSSDFIASNEIVSKAIAMVSECQDIATVLNELLSADGFEIYLRANTTYVRVGEEVSFMELTARGRKRNEVVLGYITKGPCIFLNPSNKFTPRVWKARDQIVVLAED